ncbi:MAG: cytochrome c oxidase accessory protein CcoG [Mariprofundus sp.]|nr:cytochrome c oxidase accessory protein CcoG [Mariprofundus sp.]
MDKQQSDDIYQHADYLNWDVNAGDGTVHARHISGRFRNRKWLVMLLTAGSFFMLPYIQWGERQAILFDIPERKFYLFGGVVWPQDLWMLALLMLFCFVCLFAMTSISGRIFCGFGCPQAVWTDILTWVEYKIEGKAADRIKLDAAPWGIHKIRKKITKHAFWIAICSTTAITFVGYFSGIYYAWDGLFSFELSVFEWGAFIIVLLLFYINTGFVREQVCNWICPYARIQGVMSDDNTIITTYDERRGEERGRLKRGNIEEGHGDCIDCNMCVSVCPTGVDIRKGNQLGCINCGLCIDACDSIMDKVDRPRGLIRFMSHIEFSTGKRDKHPFLRPRPIIYMLVTIAAFVAIISGLLFKSPVAMNVHHERSPLYTMMSDGSIQNIFHMDFMNKTEGSADFILTTSGLDNITTNAEGKVFHLKNGQLKKFTLRVRIHKKSITQEQQPIIFELKSVDNPEVRDVYESVFIGPRR